MIDAERLPKRGLQEGAPVKPRGFREARDRSSIETRDLSQTGYETAMGSVSCTPPVGGAPLVGGRSPTRVSVLLIHTPGNHVELVSDGILANESAFKWKES